MARRWRGALLKMGKKQKTEEMSPDNLVNNVMKLEDSTLFKRLSVLFGE